MALVVCGDPLIILVILSLSRDTASSAAIGSPGFGVTASGLALLSVSSLALARVPSHVDTTGWQELRVTPSSQVVGLETWVDQEVSSARHCLRLCWLFSACSAVTIKLNQRRCYLYRIGRHRQVYRTRHERGSLAVDMRDARIVASFVSSVYKKN